MITDDNATKPKGRGSTGVTKGNQSKGKRKKITKQKQVQHVIHTPTPNAMITPNTNASAAKTALLKVMVSSAPENADGGNNLRRSARLQNNGTVKKDAATAVADDDVEIEVQLSSIPPSSDKNKANSTNHKNNRSRSEWFITPTNVSIQNGASAATAGPGTAIATEGYEIIQTCAATSKKNAACTNNNKNSKDRNKELEESIEEQIETMNDGKNHNNFNFSLSSASSCFSFSNISSVTQSTALGWKDQEREEAQNDTRRQEQGMETGIRGRDAGSWSSFIIAGGVQDKNLLHEKPIIGSEKLNAKKRTWESSFPPLSSSITTRSNKKHDDDESQLLIFANNKTPPPHPVHSATSYRVVKRSRIATAFSSKYPIKKEKQPIKNYRHRYRLRSLSTSDINEYKNDRTNMAYDDCSDKEFVTNTKTNSSIAASYDGDIDQGNETTKNHVKTKFVNLDVLSKLHLSNHDNDISSNSNMSKSLHHCTLSHIFLSDYGSMYYQSLLNREKEQISLTKKRLEAFCGRRNSNIHAIGCGDDYGRFTKASQYNLGAEKISAPTTSQSRMRTRRFCKIEEEKCISPKANATTTTTTVVTASPSTCSGRSNRRSDDAPTVSPMYIRVRKQTRITAEMRCTLVDWIIDVTREFKLTHETLHYCVCLIDRSLEDIVVSKNTFHCLGWYVTKVAVLLPLHSIQSYLIVVISLTKKSKFLLLLFLYFLNLQRMFTYRE